MKIIIKFINNYEKIILILVTFFLFIILFLPFFKFNSLDKFDTPGVVSLIEFQKNFLFPDFQGYNPFYAGGFPQNLFYPPLFYMIATIFAKIFNSVIAYKLIVSIFFLLIPYSLFVFNSSFIKKKSFALFGVFIQLFFLIILPGYLGFNFDALFDYGLAPSFTTIPLFFFLLYSLNKNQTKLAILFLSTICLLNTATSLIAVLIVILYFISNIKRNSKALLVLIFSFLICSFFFLPFLYFKDYQVYGYPMKLTLIVPIISFLFSLIIFLLKFFLKIRCNFFNILLIFSIALSILVVIDSVVNSNIQKISFKPIHPFRILIFSLMITVSFIPKILENLHIYFFKIAQKLKIANFFKFNTHFFSIIFISFVIVLCSSYFKLNVKGSDNVVIESSQNVESRFARAYKVSEISEQSRAVIDKLVIEKKAFSTDSLVKESSYLSPYYQAIEKNLYAEKFDFDNLDKTFIENRKIQDEQKVQFLSNLLWINSLLVNDQKNLKCENFSLVSSFFSFDKTRNYTKQTIFLCNLKKDKSSQFVDTLTDKFDIKTINNKNWNKEIEDWFFSDEKILLVDNNLNKDLISESNSIISYDFAKNFQSIKINKASDKEEYVLLKLSYFPKWKAYDENKNEIKIIRVSPNFMIIPVKNEITLVYKRTWIEFLGIVISFLSIVLFLFFFEKISLKLEQYFNKFLKIVDKEKKL